MRANRAFCTCGVTSSNRRPLGETITKVIKSFHFIQFVPCKNKVRLWANPLLPRHFTFQRSKTYAKHTWTHLSAAYRHVWINLGSNRTFPLTFQKVQVHAHIFFFVTILWNPRWTSVPVHSGLFPILKNSLWLTELPTQTLSIESLKMAFLDSYWECIQKKTSILIHDTV